MLGSKNCLEELFSGGKDHKVSSASDIYHPWRTKFLFFLWLKDSIALFKILGGDCTSYHSRGFSRPCILRSAVLSVPHMLCLLVLVLLSSMASQWSQKLKE